MPELLDVAKKAYLTVRKRTTPQTTQPAKTTQSVSTQTVRVHTKKVSAVAFFKDGRRIVTASEDTTLRIWDAEKGALVGGPFEGHSEEVNSVAVSPDNMRIASGGRDNTIIIWDVDSKRMVFKPQVKHRKWVWSVCFSPDGKRLASGSFDASVIIWDAETGAVLFRLSGEREVFCVAFSPDGLKLASGESHGTVQVWSTDNAELLFKIHAHRAFARSVVWSLDGQQLVSASDDKTIKIWDTSNRTRIGQPCTGHTSCVHSLAISSDGSFITTASSDNTVRLWDTTLHREIGQPFEHTKRVCCVAISPNGELLAIGDNDGNVQLWSIKNTLSAAVGMGSSYFARRSKVKLGLKLYLDALSDAEKVIELNPSSYLGYELKHAALRGAHRHDDAFEAFTTMLYKLDNASDPQIRQLRQQYVSQFEVDGAIRRAIHAQLDNASLRLTNTSTGRLCNQDAQINAFMESTEYKKLLNSSDMHVPLQTELIKEVVAKYFSWVLLSHTWGTKEPGLHGIQGTGICDLDPGCDDTVGAFTIMLSKLDNASDPQMRQLRQQYVSPSEVEDAIRRAIRAQLENAPLRLINTSTGRLCNRDAQINTFMETTEYKVLLQSLVLHAPLQTGPIKDAVAKYFGWVMLSHRWEKKEPGLHDIQDKVIYDLDPVGTIVKLQEFCKVARDTGHRWAWVDTCCIDQNNNVELQESVNSMFIWYHYSALTIIYLSDVPPSSESGALAKSIWNTRGWTVQEFLAPRIVLFYRADWTLYLDDRSRNHKESVSIMREMERSTGINARALVDFCPGTRDAREKLRWASNRDTTREEDIAYSLFGIFDVNLPVIYGEKRQKALGRLLQEIIAHSGDITALDWVGQSSNFNSCLPADISSYKALPCTLPPLSEHEMQIWASTLRNNIGAGESASKLYTLLENISVARFANARLQLPCIAFPLTEVRQRPGQDGARCFTYEVKAHGLRDSLVTTEDKLVQFSPARPTQQTFLLVRPWNRHDLGLVNFADKTQSVEDWPEPGSPSDDTLGGHPGYNEPASTRELRLMVRVRQPFGALLLAQQWGGEYKRIASDNNIIAQVKDVASVDDTMDVRMLEIL